MPIFEYVCRGCKQRFEAIVAGERKPHCPHCDSAKLDQQYSSFAVGAARGKSRSAKSVSSGGCDSCGDPRGPGSCSMN